MPQNENIVDAPQPRRQLKDLTPAQIRYVLRTEYDKLKTNAEKWLSGRPRCSSWSWRLGSSVCR